MSSRIAFVLKGYPRLSETFIAAEIRGLEARGLVQSQMTEPTGERGGRSRRVFSVTAMGVAAAERAYRVFRSMWEGMEPEGAGRAE